MRFAVLSLVTIILVSPSAVSQQGRIDFGRQVLPILSNKCFVCHGPDSAGESDLRLDSYRAATADLGGYSAVDSENPKKSELLKRIHSADDPMPPQDSLKPLTDVEREILTKWIHQGGKYSKHWAFVPPIKTEPAIGARNNEEDQIGSDSNHSSKQTGNMIDYFVAAKLLQQKLDFAPQAEPAVLARRVALVLTGLPPEPEQLDAFLADKSENAYEKLVDQLLANPRFGEHQARYWLDAVRYGDTHGLHLDNRRGIYPYRDWVVKAFNDNLPLDKFIKWQVAGDLLPNPSLEQLVATGFVRMNPSTAEGGAIPAEFQAKNNFDRVETLGTSLLGLSLICARCHTHKYDPIQQKEYYQLLAFFNSTAEGAMDGNSYTYGPTARVPANQADWVAWKKIEAELGTFLKSAEVSLDIRNQAAERVANWNRATYEQKLLALADPKGPYANHQLHPKAIDISTRISGLKKNFTTTLIAKDLPKPRPTRLLQRGEYDMPTGDPLDPGFVAVLGQFPDVKARNRLDLARWLTSQEHPLVSRVLVNQLWQRVFGIGLVRTPEDFGLQGQQPTHPELLDWLAVELMSPSGGKQGSGHLAWDQKNLLRGMVLSKTFRQSSAIRSEIDDPENKLYARGPSYRLDAEILRDVAIWGSGLLDESMGGEGTKPYQPPGMWKALAHPGSNTKNYVRDQGKKLYRRSIYLYWKRTSPHPMMTLFDAPSRESSCVQRSRTNTSLQSLGLLNETQRIEMARAFAERLIKSNQEDSARLENLFKLLASRPPSQVEQRVCNDLLIKMKSRYETGKEDAEKLLAIGDASRDSKIDSGEHAAWTQLVIVVLASDAAILLY